MHTFDLDPNVGRVQKRIDKLLVLPIASRKRLSINHLEVRGFEPLAFSLRTRRSTN
jgi:hypothetical protein